MPTVLLIRHGRTTANTDGVLAGWTPGVRLDEAGRAQVTGLAERLAGARVARIVSSPLERCMQTAQAVGEATNTPVVQDVRLAEARYGDWTGRSLRELSRTRLWRVVQDHPSAAVFPGQDGESMSDMAARAVQAVRDHDRQVAEHEGDGALWAAVSHGDVIKAVLADALGMHLDAFQRIAVDPCSVSVVRYTERRPFVVRLNDTGSPLRSVQPPRRRRGRPQSSDAAVGGGAGDS
jgi:probable phosphomutase (TIGR03848 family)